MISLILQAIRSLMPSNLCSWSQQLILKQVFLYEIGKLMVNYSTKNRVWEFLEHTLSWPKYFSDDSSTKGSITSLKPRTWKNTHFFGKKRYLWAENKILPFFLTLEQRSPQTLLLFAVLIELLDQLFDKLRCRTCSTYALSTSAHHQEEELLFRQGK